MADPTQAPVPVVTRMDVFNEWLKLKGLKRNICCNGLERYLRSTRNLNQLNIRATLMKFIKNVESRWKKSFRDRTRFQANNKTWLESVIEFPRSESNVHIAGPSRSDRPPRKFQDCGIRAKQKKVQNLTSSASVDELSFATLVSSLRKTGKRSAATVIQEATNSTERAKKYRKAYTTLESEQQKLVPLRPEEALSLIVNSKSSKSTYLSYRMAAKMCNANIYPSWNKVLSAKLACYPDRNSIKINETEAEIKLEDLLHLTAKRLCQLEEEAINSKLVTHLTLVCKWGLDGSSGQSNYRQMTKAEKNDSFIFIISVVPLQLYDSQDETKIIWQNPVPSSSRFCRVIKFIFSKETVDLTKKETENIQAQISKLNDFVYEKKLRVKFNLILTMVDGKVCHTLTNTNSTQCCYICKAKPSEMNDLENVGKKLARIENYSFGLSTLHSWIRFFECCLHLAYRLEVKTWQTRGENKIKMEKRRQHIIERLKKELGILVDQPKPGYGSTNTGNTARICFQNSKKSAEITGVEEQLIKRLDIILETISCGYEVDSEKFNDYALETDKLFITKYPWFCMPTSVHKVLIHGSAIIKHAILPIGQLGEEAQEAKSKEFKFIRVHRTRKDSAEHTNEDLMNYFILASDPIISYLSLKNKPNKNKLKLHAEALYMLKAPSNMISVDSDSSFSESE